MAYQRKTFRTKRDAEDWSRSTEDEMVRGVYIQRSGSERLTLENALQRYLREVSPNQKAHHAKGRGDQGSAVVRGDYELSRYSTWFIDQPRYTSKQ